MSFLPGTSTNGLLYPQVGDEVKMVRTNTSIRIESKVAEGGQGVVFRGVDKNGHDLAIKWYKKNKYLERQYRSIENLASHSRPHKAFAWPIDIVLHSNVFGFGYAMVWVEARFISLVEMLKQRLQPDFRTLISIGTELVEAFSTLHARGLCYKDINFGNLLVDPNTGEVAIVDNDNIASEVTKQGIKGTLRFMAPELITNTAAPSTVTDLYSLSVFLFYLYMHGHPLEGQRVNVSYTWEPGQNISETTLATHFFGEDPIFVYDPWDVSNRPDYDSPIVRWWDIYPTSFKNVFIKAFTQGLKNPSLMTRVNETEWRNALYRLNDQLSICSCGAAIFVDFEQCNKKCWNCGNIPALPFTISTPSGISALSEGFKLTKHHIYKDFKYREVIGATERHPSQPDQLVLRNTSNMTWSIEPVGEELKEVKPGQRMLIRPMRMSIGSVIIEISR